MKLLKQSARRLPVLLLCVSMLTGILLPAHAAGATPAFRFGTEKPTEPVVLTVYEQYEGETAASVKTYTASELEAISTSNVAGYQYWKGDDEMILAATEYVTIANLLADAGVEFATGDTLRAADPTDFASTLTFEENETYRYFGTESGMVEVPAALALSWNSGSGTLEEVAATAYNSGSIRFCFGISEQQYAEKSAKGKRLVSGVTTLTVIHPTDCAHETTELVNAKPATCTQDGYTGDLVCTVCHTVLKQGEVIPANCPSAKFEDAPALDNWAHAGIDFVVKNGLFTGVSETEFAPEVSMTRAMLVTVLYAHAGKPAATSENPFTDVEEGRWYTAAVLWAAENGIVAGIGENRFAPAKAVTREQIAVMLCSYAKHCGQDVSASAALTQFADAEQVSTWAKDALSWAVAEELLSGKAANGTLLLAPQEDASRAQVATILMRFVQNAEKK